MIPPRQQPITCAHCGTTSTQPLPPDAASHAAPDLDTRPAPPFGSSLRWWMQLCPACGYAAPDLGFLPAQAAAALTTPAYRDELNNVLFPPATRPFLAHACILAHVEQWADAGWTCLHAAWLCDDEAEHNDAWADAAANARLRAIAYWREGKTHGQSFGESLADEFLLVSDVCRRAQAFDEARHACVLGLDLDNLSPLHNHLLRFEKTLIQRQDAGRYRLDQVPSLQPSRPA